MNKCLDSVKLRGFFEMRAYRDGKLIEKYIDRNHIVNGAYVQLGHLMGGDVGGRSIAKIAFGTDGKSPESADTMITKAFVKPVLRYEVPDDIIGLVQFYWELEVMENNGMGIHEFGLLTEDDTLFARKARLKPLHKEPDISMEGCWTFALSDEAAE
jgi:hypothetical protein